MPPLLQIYLLYQSSAQKKDIINKYDIFKSVSSYFFN